MVFISCLQKWGLRRRRKLHLPQQLHHVPTSEKLTTIASTEVDPANFPSTLNFEVDGWYFNIFFPRWYSEKFLKGQWDKEECVSEWQKYRDCLSQHLDDKYLSRFLEAEGTINLANQTDFNGTAGAPRQ